MKQRKGLAGDVLALLVDAGRGLTLGQIQHYLPGHYELSELSATLARLARQGEVSVVMVERTADKGRRMVKQYGWVDMTEGAAVSSSSLSAGVNQ